MSRAAWIRAAMLAALLAGLTGIAQAASGSGVISWTRPTTYVDGSTMPASAITGYRVVCSITPTGASAPTACTTSPATLNGGTNTSGTVTVTYPAIGARVCFRLVTLAGETESDPSGEACRDLAPVKPGAPTGVTVTVSISISQP